MPTQEEYIAAGGTKCPFCGCSDIQGEEVTINNGQATQEVWCPDCSESWTDIYKLEGYR